MRLRRVLLKILPRPLHIYVIKPAAPSGDTLRERYDETSLALSNEAFLRVYWRQTEAETGPTILLNVHGHECVKFDCFGSPLGHCHIAVIEFQRNSSQRLALPEETMEGQIDRAIFELGTNLRWYLDRHPIAKVRNFKVDAQRLDTQLAEAKSLLITYSRLSTAGDNPATESAPVATS